MGLQKILIQNGTVRNYMGHKLDVIDTCYEVGEKAENISKELNMSISEVYNRFDFDPDKFYHDLMMSKPEHVNLFKRTVPEMFDDMKESLKENKNEYRNVNKSKISIWKPLVAITTGAMLVLTGGVGALDTFDPQEAFAEEDNSTDEKNENDATPINFPVFPNQTQIRADLIHESGITGQGIKVVLIDSGYNYEHPELKSSYKGNGYNFLNNGTDVMDDKGHGSLVGGIIAADGIYKLKVLYKISNDEYKKIKGTVKGIAPDVEIIPAKVLDSKGNGNTNDIIRAIYWAIDGPDGQYGTEDDFNPDVINISISPNIEELLELYPNIIEDLKLTSCDNIYPELTGAFKYAREKGISIVTTTGNYDDKGFNLAGCISHSIAVGAVDSNDVIADFSGRGHSVDIVAPGINIMGPALGNSTKFYYQYNSGTSYAAAMVTGTIALIKAVHPEYTPDQIEEALFNSAIDLGEPGKDPDYGWGRLDAWGAVNYKPELKKFASRVD